ncbi:MAG: freyrasin family ranthipeptide [Clostridium sp.]|uniref:freyrasin family ranthipeptide n=1 Tax=Clostridium sp. TaxID=1506 RepID=UPI003F3DD928
MIKIINSSNQKSDTNGTPYHCNIADICLFCDTSNGDKCIQCDTLDFCRKVDS